MDEQPKQILVVRKDLNMRKGKIGSQAAHGTQKVLLTQGTFTEDGENTTFSFTFKTNSAWGQWLRHSFKKIVVTVDSEAELMELYEKVKAAGLPAALVEDNGLTEFHGIITKTVIAIGPAFPSEIDPFTSHLKLY